jgi:hypothetical protein
MKPEVLSDEQIRKIIWIPLPALHQEVLMSAFEAAQKAAQAQLDADVLFYGPQIQQTKAEIAREMIDYIESWKYPNIVVVDDYQSSMNVIISRLVVALKSKYTGGQK